MLVSIGTFRIEDLVGNTKTGEAFYDPEINKTYTIINGERKEVYRDYLREDSFILKDIFPQKAYLYDTVTISDFKRILIDSEELPFSMWIVDIIETDDCFEIWVCSLGSLTSRMMQIFSKETDYKYMEDVVIWVYGNITQCIKKELLKDRPDGID